MPKHCSKAVLIQHEKNKFTWGCEICGFRSKSKTALKLHRKKSHDLNTPIFDEFEKEYISLCCMKKKSECKCGKK